MKSEYIVGGLIFGILIFSLGMITYSENNWHKLEKQCALKDGVMVWQRNGPHLCIDKSIVLEKMS